MTMNMSPHSAPRQLALTLTSSGNADADGEATNILTATLRDGTNLVPDEAILFIAENGAFFPANNDARITINTSSQGKAVAYLACSIPQTVKVSAVVLSNSDVSATVNSTFGEGGGTIGDLTAPSVDEAAEGHIPADTPSLTLRVPAWSGMAAGDHVTYSWQATSAGGISNTLHDGFPLQETDIGKAIVFDLAPKLAVAPYDGGSAEAWYTVIPAGSNTAKDSAHANWVVGEEKALLAPEVEEADGKSIYLADLEDTFHVDLSWPTMAVNDQVSLFWQGTDENGHSGAEQQVVSHRVSDNDVAAGTVSLTVSVATYLAPYVNGSVSAFYTLNRADGSDTQISDTARYAVRQVVSYTVYTEVKKDNAAADGVSENKVTWWVTDQDSMEVDNMNATLSVTGSAIMSTGSSVTLPVTVSYTDSSVEQVTAKAVLAEGGASAAATLTFTKPGTVVYAVELPVYLQNNTQLGYAYASDMFSQIDYPFEKGATYEVATKFSNDAYNATPELCKLGYQFTGSTCVKNESGQCHFIKTTSLYLFHFIAILDGSQKQAKSNLYFDNIDPKYVGGNISVKVSIFPLNEKEA